MQMVKRGQKRQTDYFRIIFKQKMILNFAEISEDVY